MISDETFLDICELGRAYIGVLFLAYITYIGVLPI